MYNNIVLCYAEYCNKIYSDASTKCITIQNINYENFNKQSRNKKFKYNQRYYLEIKKTL